MACRTSLMPTRQVTQSALRLLRDVRRNHIVAFVAAYGLLACRGDPTAPVYNEPDVRQWVTGAVAQSLDAAGHFILPVAVLTGPYAAIQSDRANALAVAYVRSFASNPGFVASLETQHGGPLSLERVTAQPRVEFAES